MLDPLLSGLDSVLYALDTPGALARGFLSGRENWGKRLSGREMLTEWGWTESNDPNKWEPEDFAGYAADVLVDPLNAIPFGAIAGILGSSLGTGAKAAAKATPELAAAAAASVRRAEKGKIFPDLIEEARTTPEGATAIEMLLPGSKYTNEAMKMRHGGKRGVVADIRVEPREVGGEKSLFINRIHSDWHEHGAKQGYRSDWENAKTRWVGESDPTGPPAQAPEEKIWHLIAEGVPDAGGKTIDGGRVLATVHPPPQITRFLGPNYQDLLQGPDFDYGAAPVRQMYKAFLHGPGGSIERHGQNLKNLMRKVHKESISRNLSAAAEDAPLKGAEWLDATARRVVDMAKDQGLDTITWPSGKTASAMTWGAGVGKGQEEVFDSKLVEAFKRVLGDDIEVRRYTLKDPKLGPKTRVSQAMKAVQDVQKVAHQQIDKTVLVARDHGISVPPDLAYNARAAISQIGTHADAMEKVEGLLRHELLTPIHMRSQEVLQRMDAVEKAVERARGSASGMASAGYGKSIISRIEAEYDALMQEATRLGGAHEKISRVLNDLIGPFSDVAGDAIMIKLPRGA